MTVLYLQHDGEWLPRPNELRIVLSAQALPCELVTSVLVFAFQGRHLLLAHSTKGDWKLPGGHVEAGETPAQAIRREVLEETGVVLGPVRQLAYQRLRLLGAKPQGYRYPYPDSYKLFFVGTIAELLPYQESSEICGRRLCGWEEAAAVAWIQTHDALYQAAYDHNQTWPAEEQA